MTFSPFLLGAVACLLILSYIFLPFILTVIQEAIRTKSLPKLRAAAALMKTNKMTDKLPQEAVLAEDMLAEMEKIDDMKVSQW